MKYLRTLSKSFPFLCAIVLLFVGCTDKPMDKIDPESYNLNISTQGIFPEYGILIFKPGETRTFFVGGRRDFDTYTRVGVFESPSGILISYFDLRNTKNSYLITVDTNPDEYRKYTAPLQLTAPLVAGDAPYTLSVGDAGFVSRHSFLNLVVKVVANREYSIEYSCQDGYDVVPQGFFLVDQLKTAFGGESGAGTDVVSDDPVTTLLTPYQAHLTVEDIIVYTDEVPARDELLDYASAHMSGGLSGHNPHKANLFSVRNVKVQKLDGTIVEDVDPKPADAGISRGLLYSYLFFSRIIATGKVGAVLQKEFTRVVIHELAHQRGIIFPDNDHTKGHDGVRKSTCVMYQPDQVPAFVRDKFYNDPGFCEKHKQFLYMQYW